MSDHTLGLVVVGAAALGIWWLVNGFRKGEMFLSPLIPSNRDANPFGFWFSVGMWCVFVIGGAFAGVELLLGHGH